MSERKEWGGAFTAVADDASGVFYNPAGIAFALSNDISGSANAFYTRKVVYKKAAFEQDFTEESEGTIAPFVGALGKLDHMVDGLVFAFGIYTTDSELKDQDDYLTLETATFHRTANVRANSNRYGFALGKRFGSRFAVGFGLTYMRIDELTQNYQHSESIRQGYKVTAINQRELDSDGNAIADSFYERMLTQNLREKLLVQALEPALGIQVALGTKFSWGLTLKKPLIISEKYERGFEQTITFTNAESGEVTDVGNTGIYPDTNSAGKTPQEQQPHSTVIPQTSDDEPLGDLPMELRTGFAWFASPRFLMTLDSIYYSEVDSNLDQYDREAVLNFALGTEYFMTPTYPVRFGLFTNNDARKEPEEGKVNQDDHIDYIGASLFFAFVQPNSQISFGTIVQQGTGKAQKLAGSTEIQDVEAIAYNLGFSVSHSF